MQKQLFIVMALIMAVLTQNGCIAHNANNVCTACAGGFYLDVNNVCQTANDLCKTSDNTGACSSCYGGYIISGRNCVIDNGGNNPPPVNPLCKTADANNNCLSCYPGYKVSNGTCVVTNCKTYDANNVCQACYDGYTLNAAGDCVVTNGGGNGNPNTNPLCKTSDANGNCLSCFPGYAVSNGNCIVTNCKTYDANNVCQVCYDGYTLNAANDCVLPGGGSGNGGSSGNCATADANGNCLTCWQRSYVKNGQCVQVDGNCQNFNYQTSSCVSCYLGYHLDAAGVCAS